MHAFDRDGALKRADKALRQGRIDAAIAEYLAVTEAEPRDWSSARALGDLYARAGQNDRALAQYARTADHLAAENHVAEALRLFHTSLKLNPGDDYAVGRIRELSRQIGLGTRPASPPAEPSPEDPFAPSPAEPLAADGPRSAGGEPRFSVAETVTVAATTDDERLPWLTMAETAFRDGRLEDGRQAVADALQFDPDAKAAALAMACRIAASLPDAGFEAVDVVVDHALGDNDFAAAAATLQEFVTRAPHHLVALMRLVDVAMEGGLEATMYEAQAQLADAYLDAGRALEARIVAEDLVAREPWNRANIERFRKALMLLGETDPDAVIADRLSGDSPFLATDLADFDRDDDSDETIEMFDGSTSLTTDGSTTLTTGGSTALTTGGSTSLTTSGVTPLAMSSASALSGDAEPVVWGEEARPEVAPRAESHGVSSGGSPDRPDDGRTAAAMRAEETPTSRNEERALAHYRLGLAHRELGMLEDAVHAFEQAIRWAPRTADIGRAVRYDLGGALEIAGDHDRALAVFTGLESEQIGYRDVLVRIKRLLESTPRGEGPV